MTSTGSMSVWVSVTTATPRPSTHAPSRPSEGCVCSRSTSPASTAMTSRPVPVGPGACRARSVESRSGTCSTEPRWKAATTCSSRATTSTTRRRCSSATRSAGRATTSVDSCRSCRHATVFRRRRSRWFVSVNVRPLPTACSRASSTSSRSARWRRGNRHLGYKEALNAIEARSPGTKHDFYFGFQARARHLFDGDRGEARRAGRMCCMWCTHAERGVRVLPARGTSRRHRSHRYRPDPSRVEPHDASRR